MRPIKKTTYAGLALLVFSVVLFASSAVCLASPTFNTPVNSDSGHVANAISLSRNFSAGVPGAVVTSVDSYTDSLTAAVLAKAYSGPLLLTSSSSLSSSVASELARLKPAKVFLVGLPSSFVSDITAAVSTLTASTVVVLDGADRYETAALVAGAVKSKLGTVSKVIIAPGDSYGAALAASSLAAAQGWPLLLMPAAGPLPQSTLKAIADLGVTSGVVVGTDATLGVSSGFTVTKRIIGDTSSSDSDGRYSACAKLADYAASQGWLSYAHVALVSGDDYPDGEATAAFLAPDKGILLFAKSTGLPAATSQTIKDRGSAVKEVDFVGLGWPVFREVKSLNSARVTALSATGGPVGGGNKLVVTGTGLSGASRVRVGKVDVSSANWKADSATQLTISSVPAAYGDGPVEVTVFNYWGASPATTKDLYWYGSDSVLSPGEKVVQKAVEYLGVPYLWAGSSPTTGVDCSGFCMYVYKQFGISLPHSSRSMSTYGTAVSKDDLQPGDLVFFYSPISHVGMYVGGGMMINAPRSGDLVCIEDAFRSSYVTARRMLSPYSRYEQGDANLAYTGTWSKSTTTSASGGDFLYANAAGATVTISFSGTYLGWIAKKSPVYGIAKVALDGKTPVMVDLYSASTVYKQKVWSTGTLASGSHTVTIEWTGSKNASATDTNIGIDGLDLIGSVTPATAAPPPPDSAAVRYEQSDSHVAYAGAWETFSTSGPSGGSYLRAKTDGASATISFKGTHLSWIATKGTTLGKALVSLDGGKAQSIDLAATKVAYQQKVWDTGDLADGTHTVRISWDNTNAAGKFVSVDAVEVIGELTAASSPPPVTPTSASAATRYEQKDGHFTFAGGWIASSSSSASGGSFRFADAAGSSALASFDGTFLAWIGKTSPSYGKAKVTLDGGTPLTVDLYSADTKWQQKIWDTGTLPSGAHTVKIEWTGIKGAAAIGANINIDALDIIGTVTQAAAVPPTRYEQNDGHFVYAGTWTASSASAASAGSFRFADSQGSSVTVTFVGSYLSWIAKKSPVYGMAKVTLDGGTPVAVDLYSAKEAFKQKVWETKTLTPGTHTVKIEWTGTKNTAATGTNIGVDAFDVMGALQ
jgi:cell wall-associated NlpC family hydrolase